MWWLQFCIQKMSKKKDHKRWRKQFNVDCLERDGHKCYFCDVDFELDVHHIIDRHLLPNGGYVMSNGITVCNRHHLLCEEWHMSGDGIMKYNPDNLYIYIESSEEQALEDSKKLI